MIAMAKKTTLPRVALIGVSGYAREHLSHLLRAHHADQVKLVAAVSVAAEREFDQRTALKLSGCRVYDDHESLLADYRGALDLVVIPTPIHLHVAMATAALSAGANVLVEKPLTSDVAAIPGLVREAERAGRFVAVGFQDLYADGVRALKAMLVGQELGAVRSIKACGLWPRNDAYYTRNDWAGRLRIGPSPVLDSPLNNAFAHHLNLMLFLAGPRVDESAEITAVEAELFRARAIESFDTAAVRLRTREGHTLLMLASHSSATAWPPEVVVDCTRGSAVWSINGGLRVLDANGGVTAQYATRDNAQTMADMYDHVLARLGDPREFICSIPLASAHARCIAAIHHHAAIRDVPAAELTRMHLAGGPHTTIRGLEGYVRRAFDTGRLLGEVGFSGSDAVRAASPGPASARLP